MEGSKLQDAILTVNLSKEDLQTLNDGKTVIYENGKIVIKSN